MKDTVRALIEGAGVVPSVRLSSIDDARFAAETVIDAGIPIVEITMTTPQALMLIDEIAAARPDVAIGAGTVLDGATARACLDAGAKFLTSPGVEAAVIAAAVKHRTLVFPGVLTPTDVIVAIEAGANLVKLFPCAPWGGAAYLKSLSAPFPDVGFIAAGGVTLKTLGEYFLAGAAAVGVGSELIPRQAVHDRDRRWITELARRFLGAAQQSRVARQGQHDVSSPR